jgi:hypothetical protein
MKKLKGERGGGGEGEKKFDLLKKGNEAYVVKTLLWFSELLLFSLWSCKSILQNCG